jgi:hypothetical protein
MQQTKLKKNIVYTPIVKYKKKDLIITSIGTQHIGSAEYYDLLQSEINKIPFGFYECLKSPNPNNLINNQQSISKILNANTQYKLKYPDSWKISDIVLDGSDVVHKEIKNSLSNINNRVSLLYQAYNAEPLATKEFFKGLLRIYARFPNLLNSTPYESLLKPRNKILFNDLELELITPRSDNIGIVYGTSHLKEIDKFLDYKGFKIYNTTWLPALDLTPEMSFWKARKIVNNYLRHNKEP